MRVPAALRAVYSSRAWRQLYLIENPTSMPTVSIEFMHEVIFGTLRIAEYAANGNFEPSQYVYSLRKRSARKDKFNH